MVTKVQTGLRIEESMYEKLKAIAQSEGRTLNNMVEYVLRLYLRDYEAEHGEVKP